MGSGLPSSAVLSQLRAFRTLQSCLRDDRSPKSASALVQPSANFPKGGPRSRVHRTARPDGGATEPGIGVKDPIAMQFWDWSKPAAWRWQAREGARPKRDGAWHSTASDDIVRRGCKVTARIRSTGHPTQYRPNATIHNRAGSSLHWPARRPARREAQARRRVDCRARTGCQDISPCRHVHATVLEACPRRP